jgi:hypothetical protein
MLRWQVWSVVALVAASVTASARQSSSDKVVYVKGASLFVASADGSDVREIAADGEAKSMPRWSPEGTRIAYLAPGFRRGRAATHGVIKVVDEGGRLVATAPVYSVEPDGTEVGGMRLVDEIGWHSEGSVYAIGSEGPQINEYRVISLGDKTVSGFGAIIFAACPRAGKLAYVMAEEGRRTIWQQGKRVYSAGAGKVVAHLVWSEQCEHLVFTERAEGRAEVVVLRDAAVESRMTLPADARDAEPASSVGTFVVIAGTLGLAYEPSKRAWSEANGTAAAYLAEAAARASAVARLQGSEADWWSPPAR